MKRTREESQNAIGQTQNGGMKHRTRQGGREAVDPQVRPVLKIRGAWRFMIAANRRRSRVGLLGIWTVLNRFRNFAVCDQLGALWEPARQYALEHMVWSGDTERLEALDMGGVPKYIFASNEAAVRTSGTRTVTVPMCVSKPR